MTVQPANFSAFIDAARDSLAREIATVRREAQREREIRDAEHRARLAELDARLAAVANLEWQVADRLASLKDGEPGRDGTDGTDGVSVNFTEVAGLIVGEVERVTGQAVERILDGWEKPKDGQSVTAADVAPALREMVQVAVDALPTARDGNDGTDGKDGTSVTVDDVAPLIDARIAEAIAALPPAKDGLDGQAGRDADPEQTAALVRAEVERAVAGIPIPKDGKDGVSLTVEDFAPLIIATVAQAVSEIPAPKDGLDGSPGERGEKGDQGEKGDTGSSVTVADVEPMIREMVAAIPVPKDGEPGERGPEGPMGKLPVVKSWQDRVYYESDVCSFGGAAYQALRDTGKAPPHEDWACIVAAGKDGSDARSPRVRSTWREGEVYTELDIVALNGAAFMARIDDPGVCPGDGWQMISQQGKPGKPGDRSTVKGDPGPAGPRVASMRVDAQGLLTLVNADGSVVECDLYPILAKL